MNSKRTRHLATILGAVLVCQSAGFAAPGEPEAIVNQTLPVSAQATDSLAKKVWGSLDPRKLKSLKKKAAADAVENKDQLTTTGAEAKAETTRIKFDEKPASTTGDTNTSSSWNDSPKKSEVSTTSAPRAESTPASKTETTAAVETKTEPAATAAVETKAAPGAALVEQNTESTTAAAAASEATTSGAFSVASNLSRLPAGSVLNDIRVGAEPVVVDSDEAFQVEETLAYEEMPTDDGKTVAKAGARFPIVISSQISSKTAKQDDPIQGRLKYDLKIGDRLVAAKGSVVNGHLNYVLKARTILHSLVSPERWYRNSGALGLAFDEIVNENGEHIPLKAQPARQARIIKNKAEGRELGVNHYGQVTGPWAQQLRYKAIRVGLNFAMAPAGVFSFGAMPVALGVIGAANPSFAFSKPVGLNVRHRRLKGFAWGFLSGIPGSWLIEDTTCKGQEAIIKPGDEFYAELVEEFTGTPATEAQLMPGASSKVKGQVLTKAKKKKEAAPAKK